MRRLLLLLAVSCASAKAQCYQGAIVPVGGLNGHTVLGDANAGNNVMSWLGTPYQCPVIKLFVAPIVNFYSNLMPGDGTGNPMFYRYGIANIGTPPTAISYQVPVMIGDMLNAGLLWQQLSGDSSFTTVATSFANYVLAHGMTSSGANWPSVPYSASSPGSLYDGCEPATSCTPGIVEPDKVAWAGYGFTKLYESTSNVTWLNQATHYADVLVDHQIAGDATHSPWPFRVLASDGSVPSGGSIGTNIYTSNVVHAMFLLNELISIGQHGVHSISDYTTARDNALAWELAYPSVNNNWDNCCEDVPGGAAGTNVVGYNGLLFAQYLLINFPSNPTYVTLAKNIVAFMAARFGVYNYSALGMMEQDAYMVVTTPATLHYAYLCSLLASVTSGAESASYLFEATRSMNWSTYMLIASSGGYAGQVITGPFVGGQTFFRATGPGTIEFAVPIVLLYPQLGGGTAPAPPDPVYPPTVTVTGPLRKAS